MDLSTRYMGLTLANPLIASTTLRDHDLGTLRALEDHGAAAVVLSSICEVDIVGDRQALDSELPASGFAEAQTYFPTYPGGRLGSTRDLELVCRAKDAIDIPVIASLRCATAADFRGWIEDARELEQAGADALELDIDFIAADPELTGRDVEQRYLDIMGAVRRAVGIPIAVKIGPYFSALAGMARELAGAGADALVLLDRLHPPDLDIAKLRLSTDLELGKPFEHPLPLLWIALLHGRVPVSLAASDGIHSADDVFKCVLAGADAVMLVSMSSREGVAHVRELIAGLSALLTAREIDSLSAIRGRMSQLSLENRPAFASADYIQILRGVRGT